MTTTTDPTATIPQSLTSLDQWVTWKYVPDPKKPDRPKKVPFCAFLVEGEVRPAKSNDLTTWAAYEEAVVFAAERHHDGVGFVFSADDPYAGGDLDGCLDENGQPKPWAAPWVERLLSVAYLEVSPSGRGLKFVVRGQLPKVLNQKDLFGPHEGIELYDRLRYFTITGQAWPGSAVEPGDGQAILEDLLAAYDKPAPAPPALDPPALPPAAAPVGAGWRSDRARAVDAKLKDWVKDCLDWARQEMRGAPEGGLHNRRLQLGKFLGGVIGAAPQHLTPEEAMGVLYGAKVPASHHSQELRAIRDGMTTGMGLPLTPGAVGEKDGSNYLPTDQDLIVRDGRAHCPTCGERVRRQRYDYAPGQAPGWFCPRCKWPMQWPLSAWDGGEVAQAGPAVEAVVVPVTAGEDAARELPLLLPRARLKELPPAVPLIPEILFVNKLHVWFGPGGVGKSFLASDVAATVAQVYRVVYVAAEAIEDHDVRLSAWEELHTAQTGNLFFWRKAVRFANAVEVDRFIAEVMVLRPALIIFDPLANCMAGLVESTQEGMIVAVEAMNRIREATGGAGVLALHHSGWDDSRERGSSVLRNAARDMAKVEQLEDGAIRLSCVKKNQGPKWAPRLFRFVEVGESVVPLPAARVTRDELELRERHYAVLEALTLSDVVEGTHKAICDQTGIPGPSVSKLLKQLKQEGYLRAETKGQRKVFMLTTEGEIALEAYKSQEAGAVPGPRATPRSGRFGWEVCPPSVTGLPAVGTIDAAEPPTTPPSRYSEVEGYDDVPPPDEPPYEAGPWAGDGGSVSEEPEPGPSAAQGLYERLRARKEGPHDRAAAD